MTGIEFGTGVKHLVDGGEQLSDQIYAMIDNLLIFSKCTRDELVLLAGFMKVYQASPGMSLIHEGEHSDFMMVLLDGGVQIVKQDRQQHRKIIATVVGAGTTLGEMSMIDGEPRFATCVTTSPTTFAVLTRESLEQIIREHPALGAKILEQLVKILTQRLRQTGTKFVEYL